MAMPNDSGNIFGRFSSFDLVV